MIVDSSAVLAFFDRDEPDHAALAAVLSQSSEPLVVSPYVIAEVDYLVGTRLGELAEIAALRELAGGAWDLASFDSLELTRTCRSSNATPTTLLTWHPRPASSWPTDTEPRRSPRSIAATSACFGHSAEATSRSCPGIPPECGSDGITLWEHWLRSAPVVPRNTAASQLRTRRKAKTSEY